MLVFEGEHDFAGEPGIDFVNPIDIHKGGTVDAKKFCGIEPLLEIRNGLIDAVAAAIGNGEGELVLCDEVRDVVEREK